MIVAPTNIHFFDRQEYIIYTNLYYTCFVDSLHAASVHKEDRSKLKAIQDETAAIYDPSIMSGFYYIGLSYLFCLVLTFNSPFLL